MLKKYNLIINSILLFLIIMDAVLVIWGFFFPDFWFYFFHNSAYMDAKIYLFRASASWLAFLIIQILAFIFWGKNNFLILLVAGCRLGDSLTDITCLLTSNSNSIFAVMFFPGASISNIIVGIILVILYFKINSSLK